MADRPLRILMLANLPPFVLGGAENQSARLARAWAGAGAEVTVAGHRIPTGELALGDQRVRTRRLRVARRGGRAARAVTFFLSVAWLCVALRRQVDVVYCRGLGDAAISIAILKSLGLCRLPVLACPINARGAGDVAFLKSIPGWPWIARSLDRQVEAINLINSLVEDELHSVGIRRPRLSRIPNGIELSAPPVRRPAIERRLAWTGRFERQKGLDLLFAALARLPSGLAAWRLDLYGDGPLRQSLEDQARALGLGQRIAFRGAVAAGDVRQHLLEADAFVLPSRYEGMSNAAIEAMEAALPVLCTNCGGIDAFVSAGAGWVCEPGSEDALLATLSRALSEPPEQWIERGVRARAVVERHLSVDVVARDNLEKLFSLAREKAS